MSTRYAQLQTFTLAASGVSAGDSSMVLTSFKTIDGTQLTMTSFGIQGFGTCEPGSGINEEQIAFTGIVANVDGTSTLTGIHTVLEVYPYTQSANFATGHAGGTSFVISNTSGFYDTFANKANDETITGTWIFTTATRPVLTADADTANNAALITFGQLARTAIAGASNASTSLQGLVQLATQAQYDAKTATGSTGAALVASPNLNRATKYNDYVVDTGAADAYIITPSPAISAYVAGQQFTFKAANTNTTASTIAVSGLSAQSIKKNVSNALQAGDIVTGQIVTMTYDGTNFQMGLQIANGLGTRVNTDPTGFVAANGATGTSTAVVVGGTLGTTGAVRLRAIGTGNTSTVDILITYGGITVASATSVNLNGNWGLEFILFASASASVQTAMGQVWRGTTVLTTTGSATVTSASNQNLVLSMHEQTGSASVTCYGVLVDKIIS